MAGIVYARASTKVTIAGVDLAALGQFLGKIIDVEVRG